MRNLLLALLFVAGSVFAEDTEPEFLDVPIPPSLQARCAAEGGCKLISLKTLQRVVYIAVQAGREAGAKSCVNPRDQT